MYRCFFHHLCSLERIYFHVLINIILSITSSYFTLRVNLDSKRSRPLHFFLGLVHCSRDPQVWKNANITLKLGPMGTIYSLKFILL